MTLLAQIAHTSARIAGTPSRLGKIGLAAQCLRKLSGEEIEIALSFLSGELRQGKLSIGIAPLRAARGMPAAAPVLELDQVDAVFAKLKAINGQGAAERRQDMLRQLFKASTSEEQDFLVRLISGELRQGALEGIMLEAVAAAGNVAAADLRRAASAAGGLRHVARAAIQEGTPGLARFSVRLMTPVLPMLAQPAADAEAALAALGRAQIEWKLDGARVQVHRSGSEVRIFTRSQKEVTSAVPEVAAAARAARVDRFILDGEAIALRSDGRPQPFQETMRRFGRKLDDEALRSELPLSVFFFDCLFAGDAPLLERPLSERRDALETIVASEQLTPCARSAEAGVATAFYADALRRGHEGIMAKAIDSPYEAGRRSAAWLKVKRAHTLDLVVLAAEWGHGRRRGWLSNLHLGARDPQSRSFVMLGKTFKGLTDEILQWQTRELLAREVSRDARTVYVRPELVVEIVFNDIQASPQYPAGLALRFARVRAYRPDKHAQDADTLQTVRLIFQGQQAQG